MADPARPPPPAPPAPLSAPAPPAPMVQSPSLPLLAPSATMVPPPPAPPAPTLAADRPVVIPQQPPAVPSMPSMAFGTPFPSAPTASTFHQAPPPPPAMQVTTSPPLQPQPPTVTSAPVQQPATQSELRMTYVPPPQPSPPPAQNQEGKVLKVEDALTYLDEVKRQFGDQPQIYNMFLEIMKSFKAETIDTPGVIQKVSELFRGHNNLILGFNTFLPPGYRIENSDLPDDSKPPQGAPLTQQPQALPQQHTLPPPPPTGSMGLHPAHLLQQGHPQMLPQSMVLGPGGPQHAMLMDNAFFINQAYYTDATGHPHPYMMMMNPEAMQQQQLQAQQQAAAAQGQPGQPVEFDHAINYVTKIKRRFVNDADTYKAFLEILHTYQKEQKSIKEVLDQVSELFKDHPDLLKEFTYFLPDGVREKAKQELAKRRKKEELRKNDKKGDMQQKSLQPGKKDNKDKSIMGGLSMPTMMGTSMLPQSGMMVSQKAQSPTGFRRGDGQDEADDLQGDRERGAERGGVQVTLGKIPRLEKRLFNKIRAALTTRERWNSFLKCLELFSLEILSRQELVTLCSDIFASQPELLDELDRLLASRGVTDDQKEDGWFAVPMADIDFSQSRRCTPSYRSLPPDYPKPPCSERTALCRAVLNDTWVAVPTGSEDSSFKAMRRNQYEENLFKCEDERFEMDLVIEANQSAICALEILCRDIDAYKARTEVNGAQNETQFRIDRRTLSVIHLKAIARVYGDRAKEIFELIRKSPASAIPVVLTRLRAKDLEWKKTRARMNEIWRDVQEKNYVKSLDHSSYYFKINEKKTLGSKNMLAEARENSEKRMIFELADAFVHRYVWVLFSQFAEKQLGKLELDRTLAAYEKIISRLIGVKSVGGKGAVSPKVGSKVLTRYGLGTVQAVSASTCEVKLATGTIVKASRDELMEGTLLNPKESDTSAYIGESGYLFVRYYCVLYDRISRADALCSQLEREQRVQVKHVVERNGGESEEDNSAEDGSSDSLFGRSLELMKQHIRGQMDLNKFEDDLYNMLGTNCYFLFTIEKVLIGLLRAIQNMIGDIPSSKVLDVSAKYSEKKTAANAVDLYRSIAEALVITAGCPAARVKVVPGVNPLSPPQKRSIDPSSTAPPSNALIGQDDKILAYMDLLWENSPHIVVEILDSIPQQVSYGAAGSGRSLSPVGFEADGSAVMTEMGELEFALPIRFELKIKGSPSGATAQEETGKKKTETTDTAILAVFSAEKLPGSDDVFRRINAFKAESQSEKDWWRSSTSQLDRTISPAPEDSSSSNEDAPPGKRMRGATEEMAE